MKKKFLMFIFLFFVFFCFDLDVVKADEFTFTFNSSASEVKGNIKHINSELSTGSPIKCKVVVVDDTSNGFNCSYLPGTGPVTGKSYSFKPTGNYMVFSNSRGENNTLRITEFESDCKSESGSNSYTCSIKKVVFKWESNDQCNTASRSGGPNGVSGIAACTGGIKIFCDEYQDLTDAQVKTKCPGAYNADNSTKASDVRAMCDTLDTAAFERWCNYSGGQKDERIDGIREWALDDSTYKNNTEYAKTDCSHLLGNFDSDIKSFSALLCILGVLLLVILMSVDFVKAIASGEADKMAETFRNSFKRIVATVILLLLPILVNLIVDLINNNVVVYKNEDGTSEIRIGSVSDCLKETE